MVRLSVLQPPCHACDGACCRQSSGHQFAVLILPDEPPRAGEVSAMHDGEACRVLPYVDGRCVHLKDDRCGIYADRPRLCQDFTCVSGYDQQGLGRHGFFLQDHPAVVAIVEACLFQL